jgi:hypothetical protein
VEPAIGNSLESQHSVLCWCVLQESIFSQINDVFTFNLLYKEIL